jgi:hypothetical protein
MPNGARKRAIGAAASAIATIALMTSCAFSSNPPGTRAAPTQPTATQGAPATATTMPKEFVSTRYGFAVTLPQDWSGVDASFTWDGKGLQSPGSPFFANVTAPAGQRTLMGASAAVPKGMQLTKWQAAMVRAHLSSCSNPTSVQATTLGGEPALTWTERCDSGTVNSTKIAALHGGRGYMIYMPSAAANDAEDRRIFEGMRQSFRFTS